MSCAGPGVDFAPGTEIFRGGKHAFFENSVGVLWVDVVGRSRDESVCEHSGRKQFITDSDSCRWHGATTGSTSYR
jgi:hypothetical protein